jgi:hypothetical protein
MSHQVDPVSLPLSKYVRHGPSAEYFVRRNMRRLPIYIEKSAVVPYTWYTRTTVS